MFKEAYGLEQWRLGNYRYHLSIERDGNVTLWSTSYGSTSAMVIKPWGDLKGYVREHFSICFDGNFPENLPDLRRMMRPNGLGTHSMELRLP